MCRTLGDSLPAKLRVFFPFPAGARTPDDSGLLASLFVSPLFGNREDKAAQKDAANAEVDRLLGLPVPELAAEVMPAFGPDGPRGHGPNGGINILQVMIFMMRSFPKATGFMTKLQEPVRESVQALENAGLALRSGTRDGSWYSATRLGQSALADGTVSQQLKAS